MTLYRYDLLTPSQFEHLVVHIAAAHFKASKIQMFGEGPDGGVDGIVEFHNGDRAIRLAVQAKRHQRYPTSQIIKEIKQFDAERFDGLLIVTSADPSPTTVERTETAFRKHAPFSIYHHWTGSHLDSQINADPACAINFAAIASYDSPLERLLRIPVLRRGLDDLSRIENQKSLAVTDMVGIVAQTALDRKVCIVTGRPGIGKTTTSLLAAQEIIAHFRESGLPPPLLATLTPYDDISVPFDTSLPIIFIYDDFLGPTSLTAEAQRGNLREVLRLVEKCRTGDNYLILTSRSYLIGDYFRARDERDLFGAFGINDDEACVIECDSQLMRAQILSAQLRGYIHENREQIGSREYLTFKKAFLDNRRYKEILRADHFDPRALNFALQREKKLDSGTLDRILQGMGDLHQQYKDGFLTLTGDEKEFLRKILILGEAGIPYSSPIDDPAEMALLIRALEGIWVERHELPAVAGQARKPQFRLTSPAIREFLSTRFAGSRLELVHTWETAKELNRPHAVFVILGRYLKRSENYEFLTRCLLQLVNDDSLLGSQRLIEETVAIGVDSDIPSTRLLAHDMFHRWLVLDSRNSVSVDSSFYVDVLRLTEPTGEGFDRTPAVLDFLHSVDVNCVDLDHLAYIAEWISHEPHFPTRLVWVERELEMEWDGLKQDIDSRPKYYERSDLNDEAEVFEAISQSFGLEWNHSAEELVHALGEALEYEEQRQEYEANMSERPTGSFAAGNIYAIVSSAFSVDH